MVLRMTITGTQKDITIDIEDALNQLGVGSLERSICSSRGDKMNPRKRGRDPAELVSGSRPSPYQPRTPVKGGVSKSPEVAADVTRYPDLPVYLASTLRSPSLSPQQKAENDRLLRLARSRSPALETADVLEFYDAQRSAQYLPRVPQVKSSPSSETKAAAEHDEANPSPLPRPQIAVFLPGPPARSTHQSSYSAHPTANAEVAKPAVRQAITYPEHSNQSHPADNITTPPATAIASTIFPPPCPAPARNPSSDKTYQPPQPSTNTNPSHLHLAQRSNFWERRRSPTAILRDLMIHSVKEGRSTVAQWRALGKRYRDDRKFQSGLSPTERSMVVGRIDVCVKCLEDVLREGFSGVGRGRM